MKKIPFLFSVLLAVTLSTPSFAGEFKIPEGATNCLFKTAISYYSTMSSLTTSYYCDGSGQVYVQERFSHEEEQSDTVAKAVTLILSRFTKEGFEVVSISPNIHDKKLFSYGKDFVFSGVVSRKAASRK